MQKSLERALNNEILYVMANVFKYLVYLQAKKYFELIFNRGSEQPPRPREERLQEVAYHFSTGILFALKN